MATLPENPLLSDDPRVWEELIESAGPASILVVIQKRMSASLLRRHAPEDVWQETLAHLWRDRSSFSWEGKRAFRSLLLTIADNRIRDMAEKEGALKRGGAHTTQSISSASERGSPTLEFPLRIQSTTPGGIAILREQAEAMREALESLPRDLREVVHLRLFEQLTIAEVAQAMGIGASAAYHRFRKGAELYQQRLVAQLATRSGAMSLATASSSDGQASLD